MRNSSRRPTSISKRPAAYAEPGQDAVIAALIRYYQTGDPADWIRFGIAWVGNDRPVDFANGFIEVYRDARGGKGNLAGFRQHHRRQAERPDDQDRRQRAVL